MIVRIAEHPRVHFVGAALSASFEVVSWFTTLDDPYQITPILFILTVVFIGLFALGQYLEAEALREEKKPKFDIVFSPDEGAWPDSRPYLQLLEFHWQDDPFQPAYVKEDRRYRVGIMSLCAAIVPAVRLVLVDALPKDNWIHSGHTLLVMDTDPPAGEAPLHPSNDGKPTLFFDVVCECDAQGQVPASFRFEYANPQLRGPVLHNPRYGEDYSYTIQLRAEGGGWSCERWFKVSKGWDVKHGRQRLRMEPL